MLPERASRAAGSAATRSAAPTRASAAALAAAIARLAAAGCVAAEEEAEELLAAIPAGPEREAAVRRREAGEPLAWITGTATFCGRALRVEPGVYVPRPQTEPLARRAGSLLAGAGAGALAVDLCTGAGAVAAHCMEAAPQASVVGVDIDRRAVTCAARNGVRAVLGDLGAPLVPGCAAVVTAVAPYVPSGAVAYLPADVQRYEPRAALDGGADGLDVVRRVVADAVRLLRPGGWVLLEVGGAQDAELEPVLDAWGFDTVSPWRDEDGDLRGVAGRRAG